MGDLGEKNVSALLNYAIQNRIGSGMAAAWGALSDLENGRFHHVYAGKNSFLNSSLAVSAGSIFDLASLTKILATTSLAMVLHESSHLNVNDSLEKLIPDVCAKFPHLSQITIASLLSHTSGLPAWKPFFLEVQKQFNEPVVEADLKKRKAFFNEQVFSEKPVFGFNEKVLYSDIGFLILGYLFEKKMNLGSFNHLVENLVWKPMGIQNQLQFRPRFAVENLKSKNKVVCTQSLTERGLLQGEVQDDNAWCLGGVAPHAGVFGTLSGVVAWVRALMGQGLVSKTTLDLFFQETRLHQDISGFAAPSGKALGFDLPSKNGQGSTGFSFSPSSVGHLGYTGTSLWIDLQRGTFAVLLSNQTSGPELKKLRQAFHEQVCDLSIKGKHAI